MDYKKKLKDFTKSKDYFIALDSDGCVFDTMEIKHRQCFGPALVKLYKLQNREKWIIDYWNHINLYSTHRGINRFKGLYLALEHLVQHSSNSEEFPSITSIEDLKQWVTQESKLSMDRLKARMEERGTDDLKLAFQWSLESNRLIEQKTQNLPPYSGVKEAMDLITPHCDCLVSSSSAVDILIKEWGDNDLLDHIQLVAGQEMGSKSEHLALCGIDRYHPQKRLMVGDAPGDYKAAQANGALFFPIFPGKEEQSWQEFIHEGLPRFRDLQFQGEYQNRRVDRFFQILTSE